ncbi:MAG: ADP-glyceromanno-heptose 6-epimerase [Bdellovibrionales bacterium]|nr:ADP-glyceromanno-heptose 6-epimerase [Bdellovibrionales bacterium]
MYVVTGGAGFIGSAFVATLNEHELDEIYIVDELKESSKWRNLIGKRYADYFHKDDFLSHLLSGRFRGQLTGIIHMGACSSTTEQNGDYLMQNNYHYSKELAKYCLENNVRLIYASSGAIYGDGSAGFLDDDSRVFDYRPLNRYGYSKQLFDQWVIQNDYQNQVVGLRFFNVYGPNEYHKGSMKSVVYQAFHQAQKEGSIGLFRSYREDYADGEQKRDFIYVKDCCEVMWWFLNNSQTNGIFNLGTGGARSWNDLAKSVFAALGKKPSISYIEMPDNLIRQYQYFTEAPMEKLKNTGAPLPSHQLEQGVNDYVQNYLMNSDRCM